MGWRFHLSPFFSPLWWGKLDRWLGWDLQNQPALSWPGTGDTLESMTILIWLEMPEMFGQEALVWFTPEVIYVCFYLIFLLLHSNLMNTAVQKLCMKRYFTGPWRLVPESQPSHKDGAARGRSVGTCGWSSSDGQAISPYFSARSFQRLVYFFSQKS